MPYAPGLQEVYLPATLSHEDYPDLIAEGQTIDTIAVGAVLAVFNWAPNSERYRRVAKFTKALFENFDKLLQPPRHPKWKEVNLAAEAAGLAALRRRAGTAEQAAAAAPAAACRPAQARFRALPDQVAPAEAVRASATTAASSSSAASWNGATTSRPD